MGRTCYCYCHKEYPYKNCDFCERTACQSPRDDDDHNERWDFRSGDSTSWGGR